MTDLTPEELRAACDAASLDCWHSATHGQRAGILSDSGREEWSLPEDHPALPAYVASLLVEKAKNKHSGDAFKLAMLGPLVDSPFATPAQKIRAAMEALNNDA